MADPVPAPTVDLDAIEALLTGATPDNEDDTAPASEWSIGVVRQVCDAASALLAEVSRLAAELSVLRAREAQVREMLNRWAALAPADDWGNDMVDTMKADMARHLLAVLDGTTGSGKTG